MPYFNYCHLVKSHITSTPTLWGSIEYCLQVRQSLGLGWAVAWVSLSLCFLASLVVSCCYRFIFASFTVHIFCPWSQTAWDLTRLLWLVQEPNWVFNLVFKCRMSLSKRCVSNNSSTADQIPGSRLPLWKKGTILGPAPFPPGQAADDNSNYTSLTEPAWSVFGLCLSSPAGILTWEVGRFRELHPSDHDIYQSNSSGWALVFLGTISHAVFIFTKLIFLPFQCQLRAIWQPFQLLSVGCYKPIFLLVENLSFYRFYF